MLDQSCADDVLLGTGGRSVQGRAELDAMIADFQHRRPEYRAVFSSAIDVQGHLFRYTGVVEESVGTPRGEALDTGECNDEGRIRMLLTFVGAAVSPQS